VVIGGKLVIKAKFGVKWRKLVSPSNKNWDKRPQREYINKREENHFSHDELLIFLNCELRLRGF